MSDNRKAFDAPYTSVPVYYPDELSIVGGRDQLTDPRQRGPLDTTSPAKSDSLHRPKRLKQDFKLGFVESIDANGVQQDISIVLRDKVPTVEYGQMRTRAARIVNAERKKRVGCSNLSDRKAAERCAAAGMPLVILRCSGKKSRSDITALGRILVENNQRHPDDIETTIDLAKQYLDATENDYELVARSIGQTVVGLKALIKFDEHATDETRAMVREDRISVTAAAIIVAQQDPVEQNKLLAELVSAKVGAGTVRRARQIAAGAPSGRKRPGKSWANPFVGRKDLVRFKEIVAAKVAKTEDAFLQGANALLEVMTTGECADPRITKLLEQFKG